MPPAPQRSDVNRGVAWIGLASALVGILDFAAILIILKFWLSPTDYGIATKALWIFPILDLATDLGLSAAVIQRDDHDDAKISTVFWLNLSSAALLFGLLVILAPLAATHLYGHKVVGYMLIAYGSKLLWQNVYFIPIALMRRELRFKELSIIRIFANIAEFAGKVGFAAAGFGVWCFVLGPLCRVVVTGVGAQLRHPWRPKLVLRLRDAKDYASFGLKTSGSQMLFHFYTNIDYPIVGYYFGDAALGVYRVAYEIALEPVRVISHVIVDIAFPTFAKLRYAKDKLIAQFLSFTRLNLITVMTYSALVLVAAPDFIAVFFPKYQAAEEAVRILCVVAVLRAVSYVVPPLLDGTGYPSRTVVYTATAAIALPISYIVGARLLGDQVGFVSVAWAWAVGYPIAFAVLAWMALGVLDLPLRAYLGAIVSVTACVALGALAGWGVHLAIASRTGAGLTLLATTITIVGVTGLALAYGLGLSPRTAMRALKDEQPVPVSTDAEPPAAAPG